MKKLASKAIRGFTLIELMIVVAIIGILAAIAIPKFADLVTKSKESAVKGSLGSLRSAVSIYYSDTEGIFPKSGSLSTALCTSSKYLSRLPYASIPRPGSHANQFNESTTMSDWNGAWFYVSSEGATAVCCTHTDTKTSKWSTW